MKRNDTSKKHPAPQKPKKGGASETPESVIFLENDKKMQNHIFGQEPPELNLADIFKMLGKAFWKLLVAFKYLVYRLWAKYFKGKNIAWFKIGILTFFAYVALQKDMQFQMNMKSPISFFTGEDKGEENGGAKAQKMSWKGDDGGNPFAPVSPDMLRRKATTDYVDRFTDIAVTEMNKFGVPASIKMAQALIESRAGDSTLAKKNNNHFGMKCFSKNCKKGHCSNFLDDHHKDFFRKYDSAWESWRAHSLLISAGRYEHLKKHGKDYKKWAYGLKKAGYATDKRYAEKLIAMIEKYDLDKLDRL